MFFYLLDGETTRDTMRRFSLELQGVFSVPGPAVNCRAQGWVRLVEVTEHEDKLLNETL